MHACLLSLFVTCNICNMQVSKTEQILQDWNAKLENLHESYKWLLFFRVPKLLVLYDCLSVDVPLVDAVTTEVCFLFRRDQDTKKKLKSAVKVGSSRIANVIHSYIHKYVLALACDKKQQSRSHLKEFGITNGHSWIVSARLILAQQRYCFSAKTLLQP